MKLSLKWVQQFSNVDPFKTDKNVLIDKIGAQLGAIDEVVDYGERYDGIVVVKIIKCSPYPEADKLQLCWIDDGQVVKNLNRNEQGLVQIVCGGPNAKENMFAAWIPPGKTVPGNWGLSKAVLEAKEIRGQLSNGMLASPAELGVSSEHEGILDIKADDIGREPKAGEPLKGLYNLDDIVFDIENKMFTHRPDLFGILGLARELAGINHQKFESPKWYSDVPANAFEQTSFAELSLEADNRIPELVPRFLAIALSDIKVTKSPYWLQVGLSRVGIKPVNNVVDVLNFVTHLTGQPMHAFDYDKLASGKIAALEARQAKDGETLTIIGGKTLKLKPNDMVIARPEGQALALAGIIGGHETEVGDFTKNIVIECATFDMYAIRKSSMFHGLFTDAAVRYTKGQSPLQNPVALSYAIELLKQMAGAQTASQLIDINHSEVRQPKIEVSADFINSRLGTNLPAHEIAELLGNVELGVELSNSTIKVTVPFWRRDLSIKEDIVEETGRLYGYNNLPSGLPRRDLVPVKTNELFDFKQQVRYYMALSGFNELLTYSFVSLELLEASGQDVNKSYRIKNAISPDLQTYRISLVPSLLEKVYPNSKLGYQELAIYEIGQTCIKGELNEEKVPSQYQLLAAVVNFQESQSGFYKAKKALEKLAGKISSEHFAYEPLENCARTLSTLWSQASKAYEPKRSAVVIAGSEIVGLVGEPSHKLKNKLKLPKNTAVFEIDTTQLLKLRNLTEYNPINKYPKLTQDITFKTDNGVTYINLEECIIQSLGSAAKDKGFQYELKPLDIFQAEQDKNHLHYSFRLTVWHPEKTLITEEVNKLLENISNDVRQKVHAERL